MYFVKKTEKEKYSVVLEQGVDQLSAFSCAVRVDKGISDYSERKWKYTRVPLLPYFSFSFPGTSLSHDHSRVTCGWQF